MGEFIVIMSELHRHNGKLWSYWNHSLNLEVKFANGKPNKSNGIAWKSKNRCPIFVEASSALGRRTQKTESNALLSQLQLLSIVMVQAGKQTEHTNGGLRFISSPLSWWTMFTLDSISGGSFIRFLTLWNRLMDKSAQEKKPVRFPAFEKKNTMKMNLHF